MASGVGGGPLGPEVGADSSPSTPLRQEKHDRVKNTASLTEVRLACVRNRRRPTLPGRIQPSTIGAGGLNFRVRNGNGCISAAKATETLSGSSEQAHFLVKSETWFNQRLRLFATREPHSGREQLRTSPRPISTSQLHPLPGFHIWPINPVVYWEP